MELQQQALGSGGTTRVVTHRHIPRLPIILWAASVVLCCGLLTAYSMAPGAASDPPGDWPDVSIRPIADAHTLVMLAHPHCPCTKASLVELSRLLLSLDGRLHALVLFVTPLGVEPRWHETELRAQASSLPFVTVVDDLGGTLGKAFGAETSGAVVLYDQAGRLQFEGGLTPARGHEGDSVGKVRIAALVHGATVAIPRGPVYGCPLSNASATR